MNPRQTTIEELREIATEYFDAQIKKDCPAEFLANIEFANTHPDCLSGFNKEYSQLILNLMNLVTNKMRELKNESDVNKAVDLMLKPMLVEASILGLKSFALANPDEITKLDGLSDDKKAFFNTMSLEFKRNLDFHVNTVTNSLNSLDTTDFIMVLKNATHLEDQGIEFKRAMQAAINKQVLSYKAEHGVVVNHQENSQVSSSSSSMFSAERHHSRVHHHRQNQHESEHRHRLTK